MKNQKMIPFERNRYFYGKLMTVRDFEIEQRYFNDKRRLFNRLLIGPGILGGLNVILVDDKTILVEPGVAIDHYGRELVVETPYISRLSIIEGFDDLDEYGEVYLNLHYSEALKEAVHNVSASTQSGGQAAEYNRVFEQFSLSMTKEGPGTSHNLKQMIQQKEYELAQTPECSVHLILQCFASLEEGTKAILAVARKKPSAAVKVELSLKSKFINYGQEMQLSFDETKVSANDRYEVVFDFPISQVNPQDDLITMSNCRVSLGDATIGENLEGFSHLVEIGKESYWELVEKGYRRLNLDDLIGASADDRICLARLRVLKTDRTYVIEAVQCDPFLQMIHSLQLSQMIRTSIQKNESVHDLPYAVMASPHPTLDKAESISKDVCNVGKYVFEFSQKVSARDKFFSAEVAHELGVGEVFIELSVDSDTSTGEASFGYQSQMVFGDYDIFDKSNHEPVVPKVKMACVAYKNKGTFVIGIQFLEGCNVEELTIKWRAVKSKGNYPILKTSGSGLSINPAMVKVGTRTAVSFNVFDGEIPLSCQWRVKEEGGGEIDASGVYMSPSVEGVYEIIAEVSDLNETLSAFVIVEN